MVIYDKPSIDKWNSKLYNKGTIGHLTRSFEKRSPGAVCRYTTNKTFSREQILESLRIMVTKGKNIWKAEEKYEKEMGISISIIYVLLHGRNDVCRL